MRDPKGHGRATELERIARQNMDEVAKAKAAITLEGVICWPRMA